MNDPLIWPYFLGVGGGIRGAGPLRFPMVLLAFRRSPRPFAIVSWWLGADPPSGGFFFPETKKRKTEKNPEGFACVFFLLVLGFMWHEETDVLEVCVFFFLREVRGDGDESCCFVGWFYLTCVWWCFWVCSLDVFGWFLVNCRCFQFCKSHLPHEITLQK